MPAFRESVSAPPLRDTERSPSPLALSVAEEGQALERRGQRTEARRLYIEALEHGPACVPSMSATLLRAIGRTHMLEGEHTEAEGWAQRALAVAELALDRVARAHAMNLLAAISWSRGELDDAEDRFQSAREVALACGEARVASMTATNLGMIATVRGRHREALSYYACSLADARSAGLADAAMMALNNLGMLHCQMSNFGLAETCYDEALVIGRTLDDLSACIRTLVNVAKLRVHQNDHDAARQSCDAASALAGLIGDHSAEGEAAQIYGIIERHQGNTANAERHFLHAEKLAVEKKDLILEGETARELALLYRQQDRNRQTLQRLNQSHRIFKQLRARHELADVDRLTSSLESDFLNVARRWGESIESKDRYTQGHCKRVADLACALWRRVSPEGDESLFWFRIGALLHDVGKLMVPAEILNKGERLNEAEWALMRSHPTAGVALLADIEFPWDVRPIVESHHERWDGLGYPTGAAGEAIPLTARVLCIADVYDALTSIRSYKRAIVHPEAMEIMRDDVGKAFDPNLFAEFEAMVRPASWRKTPVGGTLILL